MKSLGACEIRITAVLWLLGLATCSDDRATSQNTSVGKTCGSSKDCIHSVCHPTSNICVECLSINDCGTGQFCMGHDCVTAVACTSDKNCPGQLCDPDLSICVDCITASHCTVGAAFCVSGGCVSDPADGSLGFDPDTLFGGEDAAADTKGGGSDDVGGRNGTPDTEQGDSKDSNGGSTVSKDTEESDEDSMGAVDGDNESDGDNTDPPKECEDDDDCDDGNICTENTCTEAGECAVKLLDETPCDDENKCSKTDLCRGGLCNGGIDPCDDGNSCTKDGCNAAAQCTHSPISGECDDDNPCTEEDFCEFNECLGYPADCNDYNPCTVDKCVPEEGGCTFKPLNLVKCSDGNVCTDDDVCDNGVCVGILADCDDKNPCTNDFCSKSGFCAHEALTSSPNDPECSDGKACTENDHCEKGTCVGFAVVCESDDNPCTSDFCNPKTGKCDFSFAPGACNDSNPCTQFDTCKESGGNVVCAGTKAPDQQQCFAPDGVTEGKCQGGECVVQSP